MIAKLQGRGDTVGTVRAAKVESRDQGRLEQPIFAAFAQQAVQALLNPKCATPPLPKDMLGTPRTLYFEF
jgi:hypothetical protein